MLLPHRTPILLSTTTSLRPNNLTPIHGTTGNWYAIYTIELPPPIKAGDILDVSFALHVTNDAFRPDDTSVVWNTRVMIADNTGDNLDGSDIIENARTYRVGDEAHHGLVARRGLYEISTNFFAPQYVKLLTYFTHPDANGSQDMICPDNDLGMQTLWYRS